MRKYFKPSKVYSLRKKEVWFLNIFYLDNNPRLAAASLCTIHINSQMKEAAQMLSTVLRPRLSATLAEMVYKPTHANHPCNVWLRQSDGNIVWLLKHANAMCELYAEAKGKTHKTAEMVKAIELLSDGLLDVSQTMTHPFLAMPEPIQARYGLIVGGLPKKPQYAAKSYDDAVSAYREYYCSKKFNFPEGDSRNTLKWYGNPPDWYTYTGD